MMQQGRATNHTRSFTVPLFHLLAVCLHCYEQMSEKQMNFMEERKDTLVLAAEALGVTPGASGSAPEKPPGEGSA